MNCRPSLVGFSAGFGENLIIFNNINHNAFCRNGPISVSGYPRSSARCDVTSNISCSGPRKYEKSWASFCSSFQSLSFENVSHKDIVKCLIGFSTSLIPFFPNGS